MTETPPLAATPPPGRVGVDASPVTSLEVARARRTLGDDGYRLDWAHDPGGVSMRPDWGHDVSDHQVAREVAAAASTQGSIDAFGRLVNVNEAVAYWMTARDDAALVAQSLAAGRAALSDGRTGDAVGHYRNAMAVAASYDEDRACAGGAPRSPGVVISF